MVFHLKDKSKANSILAKGFLEIGRESATIQVYEKKGKIKKRCFNCQKYGQGA